MSQTPSPAAPPDVFPVPTSDQWTARVERELRGASPASLFARTREGYRLQPVYRASDLPPGIDQAPGQAPFLRGPLPVTALPAAVPHVVLQRHVDDDPARLARAVRDDVDGGVTGLWLDLRASGIGSAGALNDVLGDLDVTALRRLALDGCSEGTGRLALVRDALAARGAPAAQVALSLRLDPLGMLARDGALPGTLEAALDVLAEATRACLQDLPAASPITLTAAPVHDAGGSLLHSIGWLLANGAFVLRELERRGLPAPRVAPRIELHLPLGPDVFSAIAAQRALRLTWTRLLTLCGLPTPPPARIHADCSRPSASTQDPWTNALRTTNQVFAGMLGGADAITAAPWDAPLGLPDEGALRLARNTHFVLGEEAHLGQIVDPAGGSFHVEDLTAELARAGWAALRSIDDHGGAADALLSGWIGRRLDSVWEERVHDFAHRKERLAGVTDFPNRRDPIPTRRPAPAVDTSGLTGVRIAALPFRPDEQAAAQASSVSVQEGSR